jgi:uncharacterized protein YcaQ
MVEILSRKQARRIALAAQGFADGRPETPTRRHLTAVIDRLALLQIDSVNVVSRSHYLPLFSRLGAYPRALLEDLAWGKKPALFEYWGHEASLMPLDLQPLLRWRMEDARQGVGVWGNVAKFLAEHRPFIDKALAAIHERGPLSAGELELGERGQGGWWGWSEAKRATECLFWAGELTTATRRGTFERVYDLPQNVLPKAIWSAPTPSREEAHRILLGRAARASASPPSATCATISAWASPTPGAASPNWSRAATWSRSRSKAGTGRPIWRPTLAGRAGSPPTPCSLRSTT